MTTEEEEEVKDIYLWEKLNDLKDGVTLTEEQVDVVIELLNERFDERMRIRFFNRITDTDHEEVLKNIVEGLSEIIKKMLMEILNPEEEELSKKN